MKVEEFNIKVAIDHKKVKAKCQKYQVKGHHKFPVYRVVLDTQKSSDVFIFYKTDTPGRRFFWFDLTEKKQKIAEKIASKLQIIHNRKAI